MVDSIGYCHFGARGAGTEAVCSSDFCNLRAANPPARFTQQCYRGLEPRLRKFEAM